MPRRAGFHVDDTFDPLAPNPRFKTGNQFLSDTRRWGSAIRTRRAAQRADNSHPNDSPVARKIRNYSGVSKILRPHRRGVCRGVKAADAVAKKSAALLPRDEASTCRIDISINRRLYQRESPFFRANTPRKISLASAVGR